jgi:hypothetical protein
MARITSITFSLACILGGCPQAEPAFDAGPLPVLPPLDAGLVVDPGGRDGGLADGGLRTDAGFDDDAECLDHSECDDEVFCNGEERCVAGACVAAEAPCELTGCLSACDEISDRCLDAARPQDHLCDAVLCGIARCDERGRCQYDPEPGFACNLPEMQLCDTTFQCREDLECIGENFFSDQNKRCMQPCAGTEECTTGINKCITDPVDGQAFNHCYYNLCGGRFGGQRFDACTGTGTDSGSCYPVSSGPGEFLGVCYEGGDRDFGESCAGGAYPWPTRGETAGRCRGGLWCHGGVCRGLCSVGAIPGRPTCPETDHCADNQDANANDVGICMPGRICTVTQELCAGDACVPDGVNSLLGGCQPTVELPGTRDAACEVPAPGELSPCSDGLMCWMDFRNALLGARCLQMCNLAASACGAGYSCRPTDSRRNAARGEKLGLCYPN